MRAMFLDAPQTPLILREVKTPHPQADELLIKVEACGLCRTDWHLAAGEWTPPSASFPLVLGHQIVGTVVAQGSAVAHNRVGTRVGVTWLAGCCSACQACWRGCENLCDAVAFTGVDRWGGFAEYATAKAAFSFLISEELPSVHAAPLLCGGIIGYRAYQLCRDAATLGIMGFGSAAHLITQVAARQGVDVYAFTRAGDLARQQFARELGALWAGSIDSPPPCTLDAIIIFAADGTLVPAALQLLAKGGVAVCAGIHMSDIPSFPYSLLWGERRLESVANLTRADAAAFLKLAAALKLSSSITTYPLAQAQQALEDLHSAAFSGSAVIVSP